MYCWSLYLLNQLSKVRLKAFSAGKVGTGAALAMVSEAECRLRLLIGETVPIDVTTVRETPNSALADGEAELRMVRMAIFSFRSKCKWWFVVKHGNKGTLSKP